MPEPQGAAGLASKTEPPYHTVGLIEKSDWHPHVVSCFIRNTFAGQVNKDNPVLYQMYVPAFPALNQGLVEPPGGALCPWSGSAVGSVHIHKKPQTRSHPPHVTTENTPLWRTVYIVRVCAVFSV